MDLPEFILLTQDAYESFGQKPPPARTLERSGSSPKPATIWPTATKPTKTTS